MKSRKQAGFALIFEIMLVIVVIAVAAFVYSHLKKPGLPSNLPACNSSTLFTASPIDLAKLPSVFPLGNINAPHGHIFPSDHIGFSVPLAPSKPGTQPGNLATLATDIMSPGKIQIYNVRVTTYYKNGQLKLSDYSINFGSCQNLEFYYGHIQHISGKLEQTLARAKGHCDKKQVEGDQSYGRCEYGINYQAEPGEIIGSAGGPETTVAGIDFGAVDRNKPALDFIRKKGVPETTLYAHCPLDYFAKPLADQLKTKLPRTSEPRCGEVMQDKAGTLQGNWYLKNHGNFGNWSSQLAMLHNNVDPAIGVVSIGGVIGSAGNFNFTPSHNGRLNREPREVTPGGQVYCYYSIPTPNSPMGGLGQTTGQVLLQLTDDKSLKAEHQSGNCSGNWSFRSPTIYVR